MPQNTSKNQKEELARIRKEKIRLEEENKKLAEEIERKKLEKEKVILEREKLEGEKNKIDLESKKLDKELRLYWRFMQGVGLLSPSVAFVLGFFSFFIGLVSVANVYQQSQEQDFRSILRDVGAENSHVRIAAVSSLFTYEDTYSLVKSISDKIFGNITFEKRITKIIDTVTAALRLEDDPHVKREMFRFLIGVGDNSLKQLRKLRIDFISSLKNEGQQKKDEYWNNQRETLLYVALAISDITHDPPDFRCFPLKGIKIRQIVFKDRANFEGATLAEVEFWGGKMRHGNFVDANLYNAVIRYIDLEGATFEGAELEGATFGPNIVGLDVSAFKNSNWAHVKEFSPQNLGEHIRRTFAPSDGEQRQGRDPDQLCSELIDKEFQIKP